jgi:hypothetical protein
MTEDWFWTVGCYVAAVLVTALWWTLLARWLREAVLAMLGFL